MSDIFAGFGQLEKAKGEEFEQQNYEEAAVLAGQNEKFTETSTAVKEAQQERELTKSLGTTTADIAGAGFAQSGSALDILRDSARQGALQHAVIGEQGLITEAGYREQADSYRNLAAAAGEAITADKIAAVGDFVAGAISFGAGFTPK